MRRVFVWCSTCWLESPYETHAASKFRVPGVCPARHNHQVPHEYHERASTRLPQSNIGSICGACYGVFMMLVPGSHNSSFSSISVTWACTAVACLWVRAW